MKLLGNLGAGGHGVKELFRGVLGVGGHKPQPEVPGELRNLGQEVGKIHAQPQIFSIGVDVLPQKGDVLDSLFEKSPHLGENILRAAAALPAADIGHDAVRAEVVAPVHDGHPRLRAALAQQGNPLGDGAGGILSGKDPLARGQDLAQELGKAPELVGIENAVHMAVARADFFYHVGLPHHAPAEENLLPRVAALGVHQRAHVSVDPLLGVLADGAGVEDDDVRPLLGLGHFIAAGGEHAANLLGIGLILLAAVGIHIGARGDAPCRPKVADFLTDGLLRLERLPGDHSGLGVQIRFLQP